MFGTIKDFWTKATDLSAAKEHIRSSYEELGLVIEKVGQNHWKALTWEKYGEEKWQNLSLSRNMSILGNEWYSALGRIQEQDRRIEHLEAKNRAQETDLKTQDRKYRDDMARTNEAYQRNERTLSRKHDLKIAEMSAIIAELQNNAEMQKESFYAEKTKMEKDFHEEATRLKEQHHAVQAYLKKDIRSRNKAIVARDNVAQLTDGELKFKFSDLTQEVDTLARLDWTCNRSDWTTEKQEQVSDTPRKLQRQILQDTMWDILFREVFSSPFRVLGKEGSGLELQWTKDFGKAKYTANGASYFWPKPSFASERWRYETLRQCQEALEVPLSEYDPRLKLRKGYQESVLRVQKELLEALELVSKIDEKTAQSVQIISEKAAKLWVACGGQRCRLLIAINGLRITTESSKAQAGQNRSINFVVRPELRRVGDSEGELFDSETTVSGCEGEAIVLLYN